MLRGLGGLRQNYLEIDFIVVSDRGELYLSAAFNHLEKYCSLPKLSLVKGQRLCVIVLRERFSIACPENRV